MANAIVLDDDITELNNFRYQALKETFGEEIADSLANPNDEDDEFFDDDNDEFVDEES